MIRGSQSLSTESTYVDKKLATDNWGNNVLYITYTHIHTYTHTHTYTNAHTHTHKYTHIQTHKHTYINTTKHTHIHTYTHTHTNTYTQLHINTHTHTQLYILAQLKISNIYQQLQSSMLHSVLTGCVIIF